MSFKTIKQKERKTMSQCFKVKQGTDYANAVKEHFELKPKWTEVLKRVNEYIGENIQRIALDPEMLWVETSELTNEENKKLFNNNGKLKSNTKRAKQVGQEYKDIVSYSGLSEFRTLQYINFCYGVMRYQGDELESYADSDGVIYFKASFDLEKRSHGAVEPITEIEYEERYLELLKSKDVA